MWWGFPDNHFFLKLPDDLWIYGCKQPSPVNTYGISTCQDAEAWYMEVDMKIWS
jgi:hypothetical protein